jgi:hypothetical protein
MKKKLLLPLAVLAVLFMVSCDAKLCYCYERVGGSVQETEIYVNTDTPCNSKNTATRGCIERSERGSFDPSEIAK